MASGFRIDRRAALAATLTLAVCMVAPNVSGEEQAAQDDSVEAHEIFRFGQHFREVYIDLQYQCPIGLIEHPGQAIDMPTVKREQSSMSCVGMRFGGEPRRIEFKFADDILDLVVIPTEKEEHDSLRTRMVEEYGQPSSSACPMSPLRSQPPRVLASEASGLSR